MSRFSSLLVVGSLVVVQGVCVESARAAVTLDSRLLLNAYSATNRRSQDMFVATDAQWDAAGRVRRVESRADTTGSIFAGNFAQGHLELDQRSGFGIARSNAELSGYYLQQTLFYPESSHVINTFAAEGLLRVPVAALQNNSPHIVGSMMRILFFTHGQLRVGGDANVNLARATESLSVSPRHVQQTFSEVGSMTVRRSTTQWQGIDFLADGMHTDAIAAPRVETFVPGGVNNFPVEARGMEVNNLVVIDAPFHVTALNQPVIEYDIILRGIYEVMATGGYYAYAQADFRNTGVLGFQLLDGLGNQMPLDGITFMGQPVQAMPAIPEPTTLAGFLTLGIVTLHRTRRR